MRMESDEFDFLAPAYVRGFLTSYARYLRIDPDPLLREFDRRYGAGRVDTDQIVALERRARKAPRTKRRLSSWAVAATLAAAGLVSLAVVGLVSGEEPGPSRRQVTVRESPSPPAESPAPTPSPSDTQEEGAVALEDGFTVEIVAARGNCWVDVTADGKNVYTSPGSGVPLGESVGPFSADESMDIVLGNAGAVDLVVNGQTYTNLGGSGEVITIKLPRDVETL